VLAGNRYACVPNNNGNSNSELFVQNETGREETILKPALTMPLPHVNRETAFDNTLRHTHLPSQSKSFNNFDFGSSWLRVTGLSPWSCGAVSHAAQGTIKELVQRFCDGCRVATSLLIQQARDDQRIDLGFSQQYVHQTKSFALALTMAAHACRSRRY
jgi:hypothetical protein